MDGLREIQIFGLVQNAMSFTPLIGFIVCPQNQNARRRLGLAGAEIFSLFFGT
jgi:hypothetical protein